MSVTSEDFKPLLDYLEREINDIRSVDYKSRYLLTSDLYSYLREVRTILGRVEGVIEDLDYQISQADMLAFTETLEAKFEDCHKIFMNYVTIALQQNTEYRQPEYSSRLIKAVNNPSVLEILPSEADPLIPIVNIRMNEFCGTTAEWISAVKMARSSISSTNPITRRPQNAGAITERSPQVGAKVFREKYYAVDVLGGRVSRKVKRRIPGGWQEELVDVTDRYKGKYKETLNLRLSFITSPAPFWEFLDNGNVSFRPAGTSSAPGKPTNGPTNFVSQAKNSIFYFLKREINFTYIKIRKALDEALKLAEDILAKAQTAEERILNAIERQEKAASRAKKEQDKDFDDELKRSAAVNKGLLVDLEARLNARSLQITVEMSERINEKAYQAATGTLRDKRGRVYLGRTTEGKEIRLGTRRSIKNILKVFAAGGR